MATPPVRSPSQLVTIGASILIGVLVGALATNYAIVAQVNENRVKLEGMRRDVDRTDDRFNKMLDTLNNFTSLIRDQNLVLKMALDNNNKKP